MVGEVEEAWEMGGRSMREIQGARFRLNPGMRAMASGVGLCLANFQLDHLDTYVMKSLSGLWVAL